MKPIPSSLRGPSNLQRQCAAEPNQIKGKATSTNSYFEYDISYPLTPENCRN